MTLANLDAWIEYRQSLRDLMGRANPNSVVFPEKPPIDTSGYSQVPKLSTKR